MKYKFTRKEIIQWLGEQNWYCKELEEIILALADKPKEECKHVVGNLGRCIYCEDKPKEELGDLSNCCEAKVIIVRGYPKEEGTRYWQCSKCGRPCDVISKPTPFKPVVTEKVTSSRKIDEFKTIKS